MGQIKSTSSWIKRGKAISMLEGAFWCEEAYPGCQTSRLRRRHQSCLGEEQHAVVITLGTRTYFSWFIPSQFMLSTTCAVLILCTL